MELDLFDAHAVANGGAPYGRMSAESSAAARLSPDGVTLFCGVGVTFKSLAAL